VEWRTHVKPAPQVSEHLKAHVLVLRANTQASCGEWASCISVLHVKAQTADGGWLPLVPGSLAVKN
jgi:hypothetical protein